MDPSGFAPPPGIALVPVPAAEAPKSPERKHVLGSMYVTKDPVTGRSVLVRRKTGSSSRKSKPSPGTDTGQPTPSGPPDPPYFIVPQPSVPAPAPQAGQSQAPHAQAMPVFPVPLHTQEPSGMHQPQFQYQAVPVYTTSSQSQVPQMMQFPPSTQPTFGAPVVVVQRPNEEPKPDAAKPEENKSAEKTSEEQQPEANKSDGPKPATQPETAAAKATPAPESPAPEQLAQNVTVQRTCTGCGKLRSASYHYRVVSGQGDPGKGFCRNCLADVTSSEGSTDDERHKRGRSKKGRSRARKSSDLSGKRASVESASSESSPDRHRVLPVETFTVAPPSTEWGSVESSPIQRRATRTSVVVNRSRPHEYHSENYHSRLRRDSFQSASSNHDHHRPSRQIVVVRRPSRADPVISYDYYDRRAPQEVVHPGPPSRWIPYRVGYMDNELEDHSVRGSRSWDVRTLGTASQEGSREAIERGYDSRSGQQLLYRDENYDAKIVSGGDAVRDRVPVRYIERQVRFVRTVDRSDRDDDEQAGITFADRERHHLYDVDGRGMRQGQTRRTQKHSHMNAPPPPQSETDSSSTGSSMILSSQEKEKHHHYYYHQSEGEEESSISSDYYIDPDYFPPPAPKYPMFVESWNADQRARQARRRGHLGGGAGVASSSSSRRQLGHDRHEHHRQRRSGDARGRDDSRPAREREREQQW